MKKQLTQLFSLVFLILLYNNLILYGQSGTTCSNAIGLECGGVYSRNFNTKDGKNVLTRLDYASCHTTTNQFNAKELIFKIEKTGNKPWFISNYNRSNINLDMFLFDACPLSPTGEPILLNNSNATKCVQKSINPVGTPYQGYKFDVLRIMTPGTYWIVVDGANTSHEGEFTIDVGCDELDISACSDIPSINCNSVVNGINGCVCPPGTFCVCSNSKINKYNCSPNDDGAFTGTENIYKFTAATSGNHTFDLKGFTKDLELFLISNACNPASSSIGSNSVYNCVAHSANQPGQPEKIIYPMTAGQTIYIVIDRFLDDGSNDNFSISVSCPVVLPPETCDNKCCDFNHQYRECYGFENYAIGNLVPQASPKFSLFNNQSANGQVVTTRAKTGANSLRFTTNSNIDLNIGRIIAENTAARLEWWMYVPSGRSASWGLETNNPSVYPIICRIQNQVLTIFKQSSNSGTELKTTTAYKNDQWTKFTLIFQPFEDEIELWIDGKFVYKETAFGSNSITQLNLYPNTQSPSNAEFFVDDICYSEGNKDLPCTLNIEPVCINGKEYQNSCFAQRAGYTNCEWTLGTCSSPNMCMNCWKCFHYIRSENDPLLYKFFNRYCDQGYIGFNDDRANQRFNSNFNYEWSVENSNVTFANNTNKNSINPDIRFPGFGTYTVCFKVFAPGSTVPIYTCCLKVVVANNCIRKPIAHFNSTFNSSDNSFTLNSSSSDGGGEILWDFGGSNVNFLNNTNKNSTNPSISVPSGQCLDVCMSLSNDCGISTYCITLCNNNTSCVGNAPVYTLSNKIEPILNNETVSFTNLPTPSTGANIQYLWDFGDGVGTSDVKNPIYKYPKPGRYIICLLIKIGCKKICYCWCIWVNPCPPTFEDHMGMLFPKFLGNGNQTSLQYQIQSSNMTIAPGQPWLVDNLPVPNSVGASSLTIALPQNKDYVICFPYLKPNGCLAYKCITIRGGNPFSCTNIGWKYVPNSGFQFNLEQSAGISQILWTVYDTGQQLGNSSTSSFILPPNPCGWRNISVIYFDGVRYWICCIRVYLCPPDDCFNSIYYGSTSNEQALFRLEESGATNIQWYFDDAPNTTLGTAKDLIIPYPVNCVAKWISVNYFIPGLGWKICCRLIWFCNPFNCNQIKMNYTEGSGFRFELDQAYQNMSWVIDETNQALGFGLQSNFYPIIDTECKLRTVTVRYKDALGRWWICCFRFWWCNPTLCTDKIIITPIGAEHVLSTDNTAQNITWFRDNLQLGTGNNLRVVLPSTGSYKIYIRYYNPSNKTWYWCCKSFNPGMGGTLPCENMKTVFREDFSSGPPNGFGYSLGQSIIDNVNWWMGESSTKVNNLRQSTVPFINRVGSIKGGEILCLTFGKNVPNAQKIKIKFDIVGRWDNASKPTFDGSFCFANDQKCLIPTFNEIFDKNPNLFNWCGASAVDGKYCLHTIEMLIDRSGPVSMLFDGKQVSVPELNGRGSEIMKINFNGNLEVDNFEVSTCDLQDIGDKLIFDIDNNVCGTVGQVIDLPIRTRNFKNISSFQFSANILASDKIEFTGVSKGNIPDFFNQNLSSPSNLAMIWEENEAKDISLPDNTIVAVLKVRLKQDFTGTLPILLSGSPTSAGALQNSKDIIPVLIAGSVCISSSNYKLCGKITREDNVPVPNVTVTLSGGKNATTNTNQLGEYCFEDLTQGLNYVITPQKNTKHINGVNSGDLTAIRKHILSSENLDSPFKIIAADALKNNSIVGSDLIEIRKLILNHIPQFSTTESWAFVPKSHTFSNPQNPFSAAIPTTIILNNLNANITNADFTGIKIGDVTLNNIPSDFAQKVESRNTSNINLIVGSANVIGGEEFDIDISVKQFTDITGGQFSMLWKTDLFTFVAIKNMNASLAITSENFNSNITSSGKLGFLWDSADPVTLIDNSKLFTLRFKAKGKGNEIITITDDPVQKYFENKDKKEVTIVVTNGNVIVPSKDVYVEENVEIFPNPTLGRVTIKSNHIILNKLTLLSQDSRIMRSFTNFKEDNIDLSELSPGVYLLKIETPTSTIIKKIVLVR